MLCKRKLFVLGKREHAVDDEITLRDRQRSYTRRHDCAQARISRDVILQVPA